MPEKLTKATATYWMGWQAECNRVTAMSDGFKCIVWAGGDGNCAASIDVMLGSQFSTFQIAIVIAN